MFVITGHKGFKIQFPNGNTVSVQWGPGNYCNPTHEDGRGAEFDAPSKSDSWASTTAEVAAWDKEGKWHNFGSDNVDGWLTSEEVLKFLTFAASNSLDTTDPFVWTDDSDEEEEEVFAS